MWHQVYSYELLARGQRVLLKLEIRKKIVVVEVAEQGVQSRTRKSLVMVWKWGLLDLKKTSFFLTDLIKLHKSTWAQRERDAHLESTVEGSNATVSEQIISRTWRLNQQYRSLLMSQNPTNHHLTSYTSLVQRMSNCQSVWTRGRQIVTCPS